MRKFIIAPDSFKGTMSAQVVCRILSDAVKKFVPQAEILCIPMSDGGEGMTEAYAGILGGRIFMETVTGPEGEKLGCPFAILPDGTAVAEMAGCAGLTLMKKGLDPLHATTYGVGELMRALTGRGCKKLLLGIGGSATNDCGIGMAAALGYGFADEDGAPVAPYACNIGRIRQIWTPEKLPELEITVACDVDNPLCGERGATVVFGPQKGLKREQIQPLDEDIRSFAALLKAELGTDVSAYPGAGAAGGLGAGLMAFCGAKLTPGIDVLLDAAQIDRELVDCELVLTGEGRIDRQSAAGKVPVGVGRRAKRAGVDCIALCGCIGEGAEAVLSQGVTAYYAPDNVGKSMDEIKKTCREDLAVAAEKALSHYFRREIPSVYPSPER